MRRLRLKIDRRQDVKLIQTVRGMGYVLEAQEAFKCSGSFRLPIVWPSFLLMVAAAMVLLFLVATERHFLNRIESRCKTNST